MEGHSANFWNEIADQIQRNDGKEQQKIDQKLTKNLPKSVQNRSWKRSWRILGPSSPQESPRAPKMPKTAFADPPPDPSWVPKSMQNRPRSLPNAIFFCIFFRVAFEHLCGPICFGSGPENEAKIVPKSMSKAILQKMQNLKKTLGFHTFFEDPGGRKSSKNRVRTELRKRCPITIQKCPQK